MKGKVEIINRMRIKLTENIKQKKYLPHNKVLWAPQKKTDLGKKYLIIF